MRLRDVVLGGWLAASAACGARTELVTPRRTDVVAGTGFTMAVRSDGTVRAWGGNGAWEFGLGTPAQTTTPLALPALDGTTQVALGAQWGCALAADGTVQCWGRRLLGPVPPATPDAPGPVADLTDATQIAVRDAHGCARVRDGHVWCWGWRAGCFCADLPAELEGDFDGNHDRAVAVPGVTDAVEVAVGATQSCARRADGTVWCWGCNFFGEVGRAPLSVPQTTCLPPGPVDGVGDAVQVAASGWNTCVLHADGTVQCWGTIGTPQGTSDSSVVTVPGGFASIDVGTFAACGIDHARRLHCWGLNQVAQVVTDTPLVSFASPPAVRGLDDVRSVSVGDAHACVVRGDQSVWCFGQDVAGQLGQPAPMDVSNTPLRVDLPRAP